MKRKRWNGNHTEWKAAFAVAALYLLLAAIGHGCPIRWITGIPCPGCGLSRAYLAFFRLVFREAFACHPLFWAVPVMFGAVFWWERKGSRWARNLALVLGAAFLLIYGGRLILGDPRMEIAVGESLMARPFMILKRVL